MCSALTDLFAYLLGHTIESAFADKDGVTQIQIQQRSFKTLFSECFYAIWDYGKNDRYIQNVMIEMIQQLQRSDENNSQFGLLHEFLLSVKEQKEKNRFQ